MPSSFNDRLRCLCHLRVRRHHRIDIDQLNLRRHRWRKRDEHVEPSTVTHHSPLATQCVFRIDRCRGPASAMLLGQLLPTILRERPRQRRGKDCPQQFDSQDSSSHLIINCETSACAVSNAWDGCTTRGCNAPVRCSAEVTSLKSPLNPW